MKNHPVVAPKDLPVGLRDPLVGLRDPLVGPKREVELAYDPHMYNSGY